MTLHEVKDQDEESLTKSEESLTKSRKVLPKVLLEEVHKTQTFEKK